MSSAATNFLSRHGASLTSDEQGGFWLNYTVPGVEFGERVIERLAVYLPLAAGNLDAALYLAEVILRDQCRRRVTRPTVERQRRSKRAVSCSATGQHSGSALPPATVGGILE